MQIELSTRFIVQFKEVLDFIAQNSIENALKFESDILGRIKDLDLMPYKYRKSVHFSNPNIRTLYLRAMSCHISLDSANDKLVILGICKWNLWKNK